MPHAKLSAVRARAAESRARREPSRTGAIVIAVISGLLLATAALLAHVGAASLDGFAHPVWTRLRQSLGLSSPAFAMVPDAQFSVPAVAVARYTVSGRVLDAEGNPVVGSSVRVRSEARPGWDWVTNSAPDGSFRVEGVTSGKVHIVAHDVEAGVVESTGLEADDAHHVVLVLDRTVELVGAVLDQRGAPIPRAALRFAGKSGATGRVVVADEDGRFAFRATSRTLDRLTVWARGYEATTIVFGAVDSDVMRRDIRLRAARPLRGIVVDPAGRAVSGARVSACPGKEAELATTDAAGGFELPATVTGCWLSADHARFASARPMRVASGRDLVVRLGAGGAIEGTAVDEHDRAVALFSVTIASFEPEEGTPDPGGRAGEVGEHLRGEFRLDDLAPGVYVLRLSAEGMTDVESHHIEVRRGKVVRGERLVLTAANVDNIDNTVTVGEPISSGDSVSGSARDESAPENPGAEGSDVITAQASSE